MSDVVCFTCRHRPAAVTICSSVAHIVEQVAEGMAAKHEHGFIYAQGDDLAVYPDQQPRHEGRRLLCAVIPDDEDTVGGPDPAVLPPVPAQAPDGEGG